MPEEATGALGKLFFAFVSSLVELGHRKALVQEDLWDTAQCVFFLPSSLVVSAAVGANSRGTGSVGQVAHPIVPGRRETSADMREHQSADL